MSPDRRGPILRTSVGTLWFAGFLLTAVATVLSASSANASLPVRVLAWLQLMCVPGLAVYLCIERTARNAQDAALAALAISPVIVAASVMLILIGGGGKTAIAAVLLALNALTFTAGSLLPAPPFTAPPKRESFAFLLLLAVTVILIAVLPVTREWWRIRSDAWFHAAVTMQIRDFGAPPEDPYFAGLSLQYMWAYHALVLALGDLLDVDYFWIMAMLNLHAIALLSVAALRLAAVFRAEITPRITAVATTLFAFNAAFWVFLPLKAFKALTGEVRGLDELARTFSLTPLDYRTSYAFLDTYRNPEFFLDKYMVATAFGIALSLMLSGLAAACAFLSTSRRVWLAVLAVSVAGTLWFHTYVGLVAVASLLGAAAGLFLFRSAVRDYARRQSYLIAAAIVTAVAVTSPFLYSVTHDKDSGGVSPLSLSPERALSILIPCALVFVLAWRERRVRTGASAPARFLQFNALATFLCCLLIRLPGANDLDKPAFPVFLSVAIVAGLAVADTLTTRTGKSRLATLALWLVLFALPCNAIALIGCYGTDDGVEVTSDEQAAAVWVREHTPRDAVFIDAPERVFLVVAGPRRYLFGAWHYASQWRYPRAEMARRFHVVQSLYAPEPLDSTALDVLSRAADPIYVVSRPRDRGAGAVVCARDDLFPVRFDNGGIQVREVDSAACTSALRRAGPSPSQEELIRASGL